MLTAAVLGAGVVALAGIAMTTAPALSKPTVPFGVRVPPGQTQAPSVTAARRLYMMRSAAVTIACTTAALTLPASTPWWALRLLVLLELAACVGCQQLARRRVSAAKHTEQWFALPPTSGRGRHRLANRPAALPPPLALPRPRSHRRHGHSRNTPLSGPARPAARKRRADRENSGQRIRRPHRPGYVTAMWTGLILLAYRSRPDLDAADPAGSAARYRQFLSQFAKAVLALVTSVNLSLLLAGLRTWQLLPLTGSAAALMLAPFAADPLVAIVLTRTGQGGFRLTPATAPPSGPGIADRDDDRHWKAAWSMSTAATRPCWSPHGSAPGGQPTSPTQPPGSSSQRSSPPRPALQPSSWH